MSNILPSKTIWLAANIRTSPHLDSFFTLVPAIQRMLKQSTHYARVFLSLPHSILNTVDQRVMAAAKPDPRVGVAALILGPSNKILMGKRKGAHGGGKLSPTPLLNSKNRYS
jgi:hypothetical protein